MKRQTLKQKSNNNRFRNRRLTLEAFESRNLLAAVVEFSALSSAAEESAVDAEPRMLVSGTLSTNQSVRVNLVSSTASPGSDFTNIVPVVIPAGTYDGTLATSIPINMTVNNDLLIESNETITLRLTAPAMPELSLGDADLNGLFYNTHVYTIINDDVALVSSVALHPVSGNEGGATTLMGEVSGVIAGNSYTVDIDWGDGSLLHQVSSIATGSSFDSFTASHIYASDGQYDVTATLTESPLLIGADSIFVIDISGSTQTAFNGTPIGDINADGRPNTILDAEIAGFIALNQDLIQRGLGDVASVSIVTFSTAANTLDLDPITPGTQIVTTPLADKDNNGVRDVDQALRSLRPVLDTNFEAALQEVILDVTQLGTLPGQGNVIFMSDGVSQTPAFADEANFLRYALGQNLRAFGVGAAASMQQLFQIDPMATLIVDTMQLLDAFSGAGLHGGGTSTSSTTASIINVVPEITSATLTSAMENNGTAELVVHFYEPGMSDLNSVFVNWGDGSTESFLIPSNVRNLTATHSYLFTDVPSGSANVSVSVSDEWLTSPITSLQTSVFDASPVQVEFNSGGSMLLESIPSPSARLLVKGVVPTPRTVNVNAVDMTATASDDDYTNSVAVQIPVGIYDGTEATSIPINLVINNDKRMEADETFSMVLSTDASGVVIDDADGNGTVVDTLTHTILNDDHTPVAVVGEMYAKTFTVQEGLSVTVNASLSTDADSDSLTFRWDIDNDGDYSENVTGISPTLTWSMLTTMDVPYAVGDSRSITVEVSDGFNASTANGVLNAANFVPTLQTSYDATMVQEGELIAISSIVNDTGVFNVTLTVDWGDGLVDTVSAVPGLNELTHRYSGDSSQTSYTTSVLATDIYGSSRVSTQNISVVNVAPAILQTSLDQAAISSGDWVLLSGAYDDAGVADTHAVSIDWGDGTSSPATVNALSRTFSATHQYNNVNQTVSSEVYHVQVTVTDSDGASVSLPYASITTDVTQSKHEEVSLWENVAQSFVPLSDTLAGAGIRVKSVSAYALPVAIYDALPVDGGTLLASGTASGLAGEGWANAFWSPISVTPGMPLYLVVDATGQAQPLTAADPYSPGSMFFSSTLVPLPDRDLTFQTFTSNKVQLPSVTVENVDPTGVADSIDVSEDSGPVTVPVLVNDFDGAGNNGSLTVSAIDSSGAIGIVSLTAGVVSYDPNGMFENLPVGATAIDSFHYEITDGNGRKAIASVGITIIGVNDAPIAQAIGVAVQADAASVSGSFAVDDVDSDDNSATLAISIVTAPTAGSVVNNNDGTFSFLPGSDFLTLPAGATQDVSFTYAATDSHGNIGNAATVTVTVTGIATAINTAPLITQLTSSNDSVANSSSDGVVVIEGLFNDADTADVHTVTVDWGDGTAEETLSTVDQIADAFDGVHAYAHGGIYMITVTIDDGHLDTVTLATEAVVQGSGIVEGVLYIIGTNANDDVRLDFSSDGSQVIVRMNSGSIDEHGEDHDSDRHDSKHDDSKHDDSKHRGNNEEEDEGHDNDNDDHRNGKALTAGAGATFQLSNVSRVVAYLAGGDDHYNGGRQNAVMPLSQTVFGGDGNDDLIDGSGSDVLIGGEGRDKLDGEQGRNILIGGLGRDDLDGSSRRNLKISGSAERENYLNSLDVALAEWDAGHSDAALAKLGLLAGN